MNSIVGSGTETQSESRHKWDRVSALWQVAVTIAFCVPLVGQQLRAQQKTHTNTSGRVKLWPKEPTSEARLLRPVSPRTTLPVLKIEPPTADPPLDDPLQEIIARTTAFRGRLVYVPQGSGIHFLTMRGVGVTGTIAGKTTSRATYVIQAYDRVFDPQFSEDGRHLLFKVGWPFESTGSYRLFLWNQEAGTLRQLMEESIHFNDIFWSPNGNFIAYVSGGDMRGKQGGKQSLRILNVNTGKVRHVAHNRGATEAVWTHQNSVLFTLYPKAQGEATVNGRAPAKKSKMEGAQTEKEPPVPARASIYEVPSRSGPAKLLIENGYQAMPSPDGRWIAFLGPPKAPLSQRADVVLYLYDRQRKQRIATSLGEVQAMRWTPDSRSLVVMENGYRMTEEGKGLGTAVIRQLSPASGAVRDVAVLRAHDYKPINGRNNTSLQFKFVRFSRDGRFLFMNSTEIIDYDRPTYTTREKLQAVDLNGARVVSVATIINKGARVVGWDWYDESG